jgi:hypothetical protein
MVDEDDYTFPFCALCYVNPDCQSERDESEDGES